MVSIRRFNVPVFMLVDDGAGTGTYNHLPNDVYDTIKRCMPIFCVDIIAITSHSKVCHLAKRRRTPCQGWWWFGGRLGQDELPENGATRILERELGIHIDPGRFKVAGAVFQYFNEPECRGTFPVFQLSFEITAEELAAVRLDPGEYEADVGLREFSLADLQTEGVNPLIAAVARDLLL